MLLSLRLRVPGGQSPGLVDRSLWLEQQLVEGEGDLVTNTICISSVDVSSGQKEKVVRSLDEWMNCAV